jgi:phosphoglycolate phosphatase-like HAD superfamily hydrolase
MGSSDLVKALSKSGTDPGRAVMVGDAVWDMIAAGRAGIRGIGLLSGGITEADLRDAGATEIYADAADLIGKIPASAISQLAERTGE